MLDNLFILLLTHLILSYFFKTQSWASGTLELRVWNLCDGNGPGQLCALFNNIFRPSSWSSFPFSPLEWEFCPKPQFTCLGPTHGFSHLPTFSLGLWARFFLPAADWAPDLNWMDHWKTCLRCCHLLVLLTTKNRQETQMRSSLYKCFAMCTVFLIVI